MGAKSSKRSVDITTTPKKGDDEVVAEGEGKLEKIGDADVKVTSNGAVHTELEFADKEEDAGETLEVEKEKQDEEVKENGVPETEEPKTPDTETSGVPPLNESTTTDKSPEVASPCGDSKAEETPETKKNKEKTKKKKWSFRSISFSKKDKTKPSRESDKNGDVKEVSEENAEATSPTSEVPKTEEQKVPQESEKVTNGDASTEEITKPEAVVNPPAELLKPEDETKPDTDQPTVPVVEEPKVPEPVVEKPVESAPSPVKEEAPPVEKPTPQIEEPTLKVEEPIPTEPSPVVEETKEVRSEEVPPPLPSSNPPSPVTVFAESTKADALPADQVPLETPLSAPAVETIPEPIIAEQRVDSIPQATSSPVVESVSELESASVVEGKVESVSSDSLLIPESNNILGELVSPKSESNETDLNPSTDSSLPALDGTISSPLVEQPIISNNTVPIETVKEPGKEPETNLIPLNVIAPQQLEPLLIEGGTESQENVSEVAKLPELPAEPSVLLNETKSSEVLTDQESVKGLTQSQPESLHQEEVTSSEVPTVKADTPAVPPSTILPSPALVSETPLLPKSPSPATVSIPESLVDPVVPSPDPTLSLKSEEAISPTQEVLPEPAGELFPEPVSESVINAESLPDISTESLPSLPEPISENLAEPMSLPPVDSVPEPIATDSAPECPVSDIHPPNDSPVLTNGNANGLPSPTDEVSPQAVKEGPLKQVSEEVSNESEIRQEAGDKAIAEEAGPAKVEE